MVSIRINGSDSNINSQGSPTIADLVELIKESIDPDHMITRILLDGADLEEHQWHTSPSQITTAILEVETGTREDYVRERLENSASVVAACYVEVRKARKFFQNGNMVDGNRSLVEAVNGLKSFFEWFATLTQLMSDEQQQKFDIHKHVDDILATCKKICQQQLYQSWWALSESLEKELEPKLDALEDFLRQKVRES